MIVAIIIAFICLALFIIWAFCRSAALGDRQIEQARRKHKNNIP
jgi:amino acid permease